MLYRWSSEQSFRYPIMYCETKDNHLRYLKFKVTNKITHLFCFSYSLFRSNIFTRHVLQTKYPYLIGTYFKDSWFTVHLQRQISDTTEVHYSLFVVWVERPVHMCGCVTQIWHYYLNRLKNISMLWPQKIKVCWKLQQVFNIILIFLYTVKSSITKKMGGLLLHFY